MTGLPAGGAPSGPEAAVPVCPRHPGRESYVRCQRCERPVCPECQRPAAVGVQCVDCVREQGRTVRQSRTVFGGRAGGSGRPVVTIGLIGLCCVVYLLQWGIGARFTDALEFFPPYALSQPYRFLTSAFLHLPTFIPHLLLNMYSLWVIGPYLEGLLGRARFAGLYLLSAVGGSVGYFLLADPSLEPDSSPLTGSWITGAVGASGAIFGLFGAIVVLNRRLGRDIGPMVGVIAINAVLGFTFSGIAWQAHLGGLITGGLTAALLAVPAGQGRRPLIQGAGFTLLALLLVVSVLVKATTVPPELFG